MAKIPFTLDVWLKDKSQKVETRDGKHVATISVDMTRDDLRVCANFGNNRIVHYYDDGRFWKNANSDNDLFIVTPEEKLTEFEKAFDKLAELYHSDENPNDVACCKEYAARLLALAIDARAREMDEALEKSKLDKDSIPYHLIEFMCNLYTCQNWKEIEETAELYATRIKAAAMKDLPRWKKYSDSNNRGYGIRGGLLLNGDWLIELDDLEKLPKEDSHE